MKPSTATRERAIYVTSERVKLEVGLTEKAILRLRRVQDLLSQSRRRAVSLEEVLESMSAEFLKRHDPVEKAKRHVVKKSLAPTPAPTPGAPVGKQVALPVGRVPISATLLHQVNLRDQRRCTQNLPDGKRCNQGRWVEIHHKIPVSQGGQNNLSNLTTLCAAHHRFWHLRPW